MVKSIWILLAIVAYYNYEMSHKDVKTAFLNRNFQMESVYKTQPEGFTYKDGMKVYKA